MYSKENPDSLKNLDFLKSAFECWCNIDIDKFFDSIFYTESYETGKTKLYLKGNETSNLFLNCCKYHGDFTENGRNRLFSLNSMLLFYAVLIYRLNVQSISELDFKRRIRIIRNLSENSQYEIREYDQYGNNQMQRLLNDVDGIIINGTIIAEDRGFNILQKEEEKRKLEWLSKNESYKDDLFKLEDYSLLKGTVSIVGLDSPDNFMKFRTLFDTCDKDLISRALLTIGDYSQNLGWRTQLGVKTKDSVWADLFHPAKQRNENGRFQNTVNIMNQLLSSIPNDCNDYQKLLDNKISTYLNSSDLAFDWRYYFIKYPQMRYDTYGMYWWENKTKKPSEVIIMHTGERLNGKNWNVFAYTLFKIHLDKFKLGDYASQGDLLKIKGKDISVEILNDSFIISEDGKSQEIHIKQDGSGIDLEDRIKGVFQKLKERNLV